jgi:hypothetical protein
MQFFLSDNALPRFESWRSLPNVAQVDRTLRQETGKTVKDCCVGRATAPTASRNSAASYAGIEVAAKNHR